jgi:peptidoglycan/xylan/chitin deacetylase (PgdA/CDA1 family)
MRTTRTGALVLSLDFELLWGVRDRGAAVEAYRENLLGARRAVPAMLELMCEYGIAATWATVGLLFAQSKEEARRYAPTVKPQYLRRELDPYEDWGNGSAVEDQLRYAPSLIAQIAETPRQEIGCHTFSHYYCLEPGQTKDAFRADLESALLLAERRGLQLRSVVFPRNQVNPLYQDILPDLGFTSYRGIEQGRMFNTDPAKRNAPWRRANRLVNQYCFPAGQHLISWDSLRVAPKLANVRGSLFLRPYSRRLRSLEKVRITRIKNAIRLAAGTGQLFHLWWHPHNFGINLAENISVLRSIFETVAECREQQGFQSLTMAQAAAHAVSITPAIPVLQASD